MSDSSTVVVRLKELIVALDKRHVQPARAGEVTVARDAARMRASAVRRIAELLSGSSIATGTAADARASGAAAPQALPVSGAPADETPELTARWVAGVARGRAERARFRANVLQALASAAMVALAAFVLFALLT
ncbi:MAG: hypothetical protein R2708_12115 [Vicinamibacterales bacterium]